MPLEPHKESFTSKAVFNSTFGGTEVKQALNVQNEEQSESDESGDSSDTDTENENKQITTENINRLFSDKPEFLTSQDSNY